MEGSRGGVYSTILDFLLYVELNVEFFRRGNSVLDDRTLTSFLGEDGEVFRDEVSWCLHTVLGWVGKGEMYVSIKRVMHGGGEMLTAGKTR